MKSPAFQFYPTDYLASQRVQMMTLEEEGAYFRLLCYCWQHGDIPADPNQAARLIGKGASTTLATVVLAMFQPIDGTDRMNHDRLEAERAKQAAWREKSAAGGRKSAEKRKGASTTLEPPLQGSLENGCNQKATLHLQSSSPSSSSIPIPPTKLNKVKERFSKPSPEEVDAYIATQGYQVNGHAFVDFYDSKGWKIGKEPMKDWQAAVRTWHRKAETTPPASRPNGSDRNPSTGSKIDNLRGLGGRVFSIELDKLPEHLRPTQEEFDALKAELRAKYQPAESR